MEVEIVQLSKWNEGWNWSEKLWHVFGGKGAWSVRAGKLLVGWMDVVEGGREMEQSRQACVEKAGVKRELRALLQRSCCGCS